MNKKPCDSEKEFLDNYNIHEYDVPLTSVDMAIFTLQDKAVKVLLVKRAQYPKKGKWALPGGFINLKQDKSLDDTAYRKLYEKTGVKAPYLEQVHTIGSNKRDPRGWSVTITYFALLSSDSIRLIKNESSEEVSWINVEHAINHYKLAFDHNHILHQCYERLKNKVQYTILPVHLLPDEFTLTDLQQVFEIIMGKPVEKKSFRRRIQDANILEESGNMRTGVARPAKLYQVKNKNKDHYFNRIIEGQR